MNNKCTIYICTLCCKTIKYINNYNNYSTCKDRLHNMCKGHHPYYEKNMEYFGNMIYINSYFKKWAELLYD